MSVENFRANIRDIVTAYSINEHNGNWTRTANDLGVSRQTIRRIAQGDTKSISERSLEKITEQFTELKPYQQSKAYYGAEVIRDKVFETGNRKETIKEIKAHKEEYKKEIKRKTEEWKDLTVSQKIQRGYSPSSNS